MGSFSTERYLFCVLIIVTRYKGKDVGQIIVFRRCVLCEHKPDFALMWEKRVIAQESLIQCCADSHG